MQDVKRSLLTLVVIVGVSFVGYKVYRKIMKPASQAVSVSTVVIPPSLPKAALRPISTETVEKDTDGLIEKLYKYVSGFGIPTDEEQVIKSAGGAATYGEITYTSLDTLLKDLKVTKDDVFYDLGSGVGKTCVQAYFDFPFKKVVGIELSKKRYADSAAVKKKLKARGLLERGRKLEFIFGNFLKKDLSDATSVYMCSTCYSEQLLEDIAKKLSGGKKGMVVMSLKEIPNYKKYGFMFTKEFVLPTSWSETSPIYVYELKK